jgi:hypothetical protein
MQKSATNILTQKILEHLYSVGVYSWRQNVLPIPVVRGGVVTGFRSGGKSGLPDIMGVLPPRGKLLCVEIKTGRDRLRPEQIGFHASVRRMGGAVLVVKTWEDYTRQILPILEEILENYN